MAINQSSLVFDGRLVIDENDRTNDPSIFAAGPLTKFKRIYHRENWTHVCSNSREVGKMVRQTELFLFHLNITDVIIFELFLVG